MVIEEGRHNRIVLPRLSIIAFQKRRIFTAAAHWRFQSAVSCRYLLAPSLEQWGSGRLTHEDRVVGSISPPRRPDQPRRGVGLADHRLDVWRPGRG